jgi:PKHD-type hydroxylase
MAGQPHYTDSFVSLLQVFTPEELDRIEAYGDALQADKAGFHAGAAKEADKVRITRTAWIRPAEEVRWFYVRMEQVARSLNDQIYQFDLRGFSEPFQYTVYHGNEGGHYDWHVDQGKLQQQRKLSFSLQLSDPAQYEGGELQAFASNDISTAPRERGAVIAFPSYVLHRVTPVTKGTRKSIVAWTSGPKFR